MDANKKRIKLLRVINNIIDILPTKNIQISNKDVDYSNLCDFERDVYGDDVPPDDAPQLTEPVEKHNRPVREILPWKYTPDTIESTGSYLEWMEKYSRETINIWNLGSIISTKIACSSIQNNPFNVTTDYNAPLDEANDDDFNNDANKDNYKINKNLTKAIYRELLIDKSLYLIFSNKRIKETIEKSVLINQSNGDGDKLSSNFTLNVVSAESW